MTANSSNDTNIAGDANIESGDFVARDKVVQNIQNVNLDLEKIINALKNSLPRDDPTPQYLLDTLKSFRAYHALLYEWKELHNFLNDILVSLGSFTTEVERLEISNEEPDTRKLRSIWRPTSQKVNLMLEWGKQIQHISMPFIQTTRGFKGPNWAIDLFKAQIRINQALELSNVLLDDIIDAKGDFYDKSQMHMYLVDKQLRETAGEIYNLSRVVLGSLSNE